MTTQTKQPQFETDLTRLVSMLALAFTDHHDELQIEARPLPRKTMLNVRPHIDEYGKLIGTAGVRINAMKTIVSAFALRHQRKVDLVLEKPPGVESADRPKFKADPNWRSDAVLKLCQESLAALFASPTVGVEDRGDTTILTAQIGAQEVLADLSYEIGDAFDTIFQAIGKAHGRNTICVELNVDSNADLKHSRD